MENINRVFDLLDYAQSTHPNIEILATKIKGEWVKYSINDFIRISIDVSRGLIQKGYQKDDKIAIMSENRPEWNFCDLGIMQIGATQVPMYPTLAEGDMKFIITNAEIKLIFVSTKELYDKIQHAINACGANVEVYSFDSIPGVKHWTEVVQEGKSHPEIDIDSYKSQITGEDLLTLIYTSGTTGTPKGVMLTHTNLLSNIVASSELYPEGLKRALSFLPLSHIFERMVVYMYFYLGVSVYYAESLDTIVANLAEVKPHCFTTVPRLLEKVYDKIVAKGQELVGIKKKIFFWALKLGLQFEVGRANGWWYEFQLNIARKLVFKKWQEALGGEIIIIVSGGAALQERLARVFWSADIKVLEGYGLTETSPVIAVNGPRKGEIRFGTVGKPLNNVEVKIAEDGEILCKGPNLMKGYYKRPDATDEAITDGWFHTGDIGNINDGFLTITDRKKEVFKTAGGKYVAPQVLENKFKESVFVEQIMVIGENRRFPSALVVPNFEKLESWASSNGIKEKNHEVLVQNQKVVDKMWQEINRFNDNFGHWEQVKKIVLLPKEFTIDGGEMTPKLSLKRKVILEKNKQIIEELYKDEEQH